MASVANGEFLVIAFRPHLTLALIESKPVRGFYIDEVSYRSVSSGDSTGFYDWLRDRDGKVIGVRFWPEGEAEPPLQALAHLEYVRFSQDQRSLEVFFSDDRDTDEGQSDDQSFGGRSHYLSDSGELAICFETYFLTPPEMTSIREAPGQWVRLAVMPSIASPPSTLPGPEEGPHRRSRHTGG